MSEADTPINQPFSEPTASTGNTTPELPDATETSEEPQIVNLVVQYSEQESALESDRALMALPPADADEHAPEQEPALESDSAFMALPPADADEHAPEVRTKDADWFALVQKMRQRNRRLIEQMSEVRHALREKQEALHFEQLRSREQETFLTQQSDEIHTLQEQLARLFHALESSHQAAQRQQILIETLSEQLQSSQERVAQLERECSLVQQRYNEQSHQLLQAANTCRELRTRLQRQQRQTLQFKVALEKSLEMKASHNSEVQQQPRPRSGIGFYSVVPKAQPIKPWSAEPELQEDTSTSGFDTLWKHPIQLKPLSAESFSVPELSEVKGWEETPLSPTVEASDPVETVASSQESEATELELEQELLAEMTSLAQASGLVEFQPDLADSQSELTIEPEVLPEELDELVPSSSDAEETPLMEDAPDMNPDAESLRKDLWDDAGEQEPDPDEVLLSQSNWPSPVLYPLRPSKKRKSLAAIDLPSFPPYRPL